MSGLVLIAHADPGELAEIAEASRAAGWRVLTAETLATAVAATLSSGPDVVWLDARLTTDVAQRAKSLAALAEAPWPAARVLIGWDPPEPLDARRLVVHLVANPGPEKALALIERLDAERRQKQAFVRLTQDLAQCSPTPLVGRSPAIRRLRDQIDRIAATPQTTVLVSGEPGTGRREIAREIHARSAAVGPIVEISCALPGRAVELELFGSTPARGIGRTGACAIVRKGTLVLRDVEALGTEAQARILELATDRNWRPIGSEHERPFDARLIALASTELEAVVESGAFREDLFYRLNVLSSNLPPLRNRPQDIEPLVEHQLARLSTSGRATTLLPAALEALEGHRWPGNERELRATLERAAWQAGAHPIRVEHLGLRVLAGGPETGEDDRLPIGDGSLRAIEERLIRHVLAHTDGNRSRTARILGVNRTTLYNKLRTYQIDD